MATAKRPSLTAEYLDDEKDGQMKEKASLDADGIGLEVKSDYSDFSPKAQMPEGFTSFSHAHLLPGPVMDNKGILTDEDIGLVTLLQEAGQGHLMANWAMPGTEDEQKKQFLQQVRKLHDTCPGEGGLVGYAQRARKLLADSAEGVNSLDGWTPSVPQGERLEPGTPEFEAFEKEGTPEIGSCGFVLVAGGLGERLGYSDIKLKLPTETCTSTSYLALYCAQILALQSRYAKDGKVLPLAIMVSDDTHDKTIQALKEHSNFGLQESQVTIIKQEKVPALTDNEGRFALDSDNKYQISTKPHGHGDVHSLMHSKGVAHKWLESGTRWCVFMQDTNGLALHILGAALGVSVKLGLEVNSLAIPRKAKQAVGGIARLKHKDGREMTVNVEYNQLDPLLKSSTEGGKGDENDTETGYSPYPGNINQLIFALQPYCAVLEKTKGVLEEFVNPKYTDDSRTTFKKPTRLECMMQDYPKVLEPDAKVGFTSAEPWFCFSPVKNSLEEGVAAQKKGTPPACAATGESDQFFVWAEMLRLCGCSVIQAPKETWAGIEASLGPQIVIDPSSAVTLTELKQLVTNPSAVSISQKSTLLIHGKGTIVIDQLDLDGAVILEAAEGYTLHIKQLTVKNDGWHFDKLPVNEDGSVKDTTDSGDSVPEVTLMRGYTCVQKQSEVFKANAETAAAAAAAPAASGDSTEESAAADAAAAAGAAEGQSGGSKVVTIDRAAAADKDKVAEGSAGCNCTIA